MTGFSRLSEAAGNLEIAAIQLDEILASQSLVMLRDLVRQIETSGLPPVSAI
jgi:hypothetical protein